MALKTNELKLGNYISDENNLVWVVGGIQQDLIYVNGGWWQENAFNPITLSELTLLNLSFVYDKYEDLYIYGTRKRIGVRLVDQEAILYYSRDIGIDFYGIDYVDSVHHLQNMCYALLEEQLRFNHVNPLYSWVGGG